MNGGARDILSVVLMVWSGFIIGDSTVKEPPRISPSYPRRHFVRSGEVVRLVCPVDPDPSAGLFVTWQREGESIHAGWNRYRIQDDGRILRIVDVEREDAGAFLCRAANGFGSVDVKHYLYVYGLNGSGLLPTEAEQEEDRDEPEVIDAHTGGAGGAVAAAEEEKWKTQAEIVPPFPGNVTVSSGDQAVFVCHARGDGEPRIQWLRLEELGDDVIDADDSDQPRSRSSIGGGDLQRQRYRIVEGSLTISLRDGTYLNKLTLQNVRQTDSGLYICSTMNGRGFGYRSAYLNVLPGVARSSKDGFHDARFAADSSFVPVVVATAVVIGAILILGAVLVVCRSHFRRKSPSSATMMTSAADPSSLDGFPVRKSEQSSTTTTLSRIPTKSCHVPEGRNPRRPGYRSVVPHPPPPSPSPRAPLAVRSIFPAVDDTSSECSTLFKPTPAPATTPVPPTELEYRRLEQRGYVDDSFLRRPYQYHHHHHHHHSGC